MSFTVAILGRPNVGKSTLFNRLAGKRLALVDDTPGVTRDRREGQGRLGDLRFKMIDTAGLEEAEGDGLEARMRQQTERALAEADVALMLVDGRAGVTPLDEHFARIIRKSPTPVVLAVNKCEGRAGQEGLAQSYGMGLGDPIGISAEHGEGLLDLYELFLPFSEPFLSEEDVEFSLKEGKEFPEEEEKGPLKLAIVGRPNVGKSTLINYLIGEERLLTGPEPGVTRDAIAVEWEHKGRAIQLVDTAGLRRRSKITEKLEKLSTADTLRAVNYAHVVALVLDAELLLEKQDLTIARMVVDEGRALVLVVNKWDMIKDRKQVLRVLADRLERSLPQVRGLLIVTLSAKTGASTKTLMPAVLQAYDTWNRRLSTSKLNRWLDNILAHHPPPAVSGRRIKLRYITQIKSRPPTFALFVNTPEGLPDSYSRYLMNKLREDFDLPGTPIRIHLRKGKNPYVDG
ncbi:MAG: ribosome biogenesis GTPase Der [Rhodospirillaceae bacterium]|jgi:GTPase|nr:ribosome biogenesis GTPase Der [Rhodospirillaceae bacterium]MBT5374324.1 ribosome biogenesis GTPase Der [Rhodospirillaceae bacterium]MBT5658831.1 ribosome biogenesis GTPase Der [Rhodospirillaceae bacterium]